MNDLGHRKDILATLHQFQTCVFGIGRDEHRWWSTQRGALWIVAMMFDDLGHARAPKLGVEVGGPCYHESLNVIQSFHPSVDLRSRSLVLTVQVKKSRVLSDIMRRNAQSLSLVVSPPQALHGRIFPEEFAILEIIGVRGSHPRERQKVPLRAIVEGDLFRSPRSSSPPKCLSQAHTSQCPNRRNSAIHLRCDSKTTRSRFLRHWYVNDLFNDATAWMDNDCGMT